MSREHGIAPICQHLHSDVASLLEGRKQLLRCNDIPSDHSHEDFEGDDFSDDEKCDNELLRGDVRFGDGRNNPRRVDFAIPLAVSCGVLPASLYRSVRLPLSSFEYRLPTLWGNCLKCSL